MSFYDQFRALQANLFDTFEAPTATITHSAPGVRTKANRASGVTPAPIVTTTTARGLLAIKKAKAEDGTIKQVLTAKLDGAVQIDDRITVGAQTFTVTSVQEVNPDSTTPILWIAFLK